MSEDLTKKLPESENGKINQILTAVKSLDAKVSNLDAKVSNLDAKVSNLDAKVSNLDAKVSNLDAKVSNLEANVSNLDAKVSNLDAKVSNLEAKVGNIDSRLEQLEQKVEHRLHDTRPIWHKVVADIAQLQEGQQRLERGQDALRADVIEIKTTVRDINRDQIVINDVVRKIQLDFHNIDARLHRIEINRDRQNSST